MDNKYYSVDRKMSIFDQWSFNCRRFRKCLSKKKQWSTLSSDHLDMVNYHERHIHL